MEEWKITQHKSRMPKLNKPILIEGLPGIGNVGKLAADYLITELKAKELLTYHSYHLPNSVYVNEQHLVDLPRLSLYYVTGKHVKQDLLILTGDAQPNDEHSSYTFTELILRTVKQFNTKEIITTGGIDLPDIPENPDVYITGNDRDLINKYKKFGKVNDKIYGVVGPIMGVTGLLTGMADIINAKSVSLLVETCGHPLFIGYRGAKDILLIIQKRCKMQLKMDKMDKEIERYEEELGKQQDMLLELSDKKEKTKKDKVSYIG
ncbi:PAC2 family protein [Candidatus Woesearchaeota archaeon]|nr:PAC2 family protein [Candidatus Woesearchaeota archaeon]